MSSSKESGTRTRGVDTFSTTFYVFLYQPACGWAGTTHVDQQVVTKPTERGSTLVLLPRTCQFDGDKVGEIRMLCQRAGI